MITTIKEFKQHFKINEESRPATDLEKEVFEFLNDLRLSGVTNMYGAVPYILEEYPDLHKNVASKLLGLWMKNFNENGDYDTINENNIEDMLHINLLDKYKETNPEIRQKFEEYKSKIKGFKTEHLALKAGDIIEFNGGYNNDIRYTTEILGFDEDGDIYLLWDSYWFPIRNEESRAIKLINNVNESKIIRSPKQIIKQIIKDNSNFKWLNQYNINTFNKLEKILQEHGYGSVYNEYIIFNNIDDTNVNESKVNNISKLNREISTIKDRLKNKWKNKGGYENFGDNEYRKLKDKYSYNPYGNSEEREIAAIIDRFDDWAMNFTGESKVTENIDNSLETLYTEQDLESAFEAGADSVEYDENHGYINKTNFRDFLTTFKSNRDKVIENIDTTQLPKALEDIDERRPNRMKKPNAYGYANDFAGPGGVRGMVYIQDEAQQVMQDKYGRERGTRMWEASINAPQRGAMFKMADDVMKEKMFLYHQANLSPRTYWDVSYYALWKMWMESQGLSYKIDSDEDVANKKAEKERLEREENERKAQAIKDQKLKQFNDAVSNLIKNLDPAIKPDSKDMARIASMMSKNDPTTMAGVMASAIKDKNKAIRRGLAVIEWFKQNRPLEYYEVKWVASPFLNKAKQL